MRKTGFRALLLGFATLNFWLQIKPWPVFSTATNRVLAPVADVITIGSVLAALVVLVQISRDIWRWADEYPGSFWRRVLPGIAAGLGMVGLLLTMLLLSLLLLWLVLSLYTGIRLVDWQDGR